MLHGVFPSSNLGQCVCDQVESFSHSWLNINVSQIIISSLNYEMISRINGVVVKDVDSGWLHWV